MPKEVGGHMDLDYVLRILHEEKQKLERVIASLEQLLAIQAIGSTTAVTAKERGRKSMSEEERRKVSDRMKRFGRSERKGKFAQAQTPIISPSSTASKFEPAPEYEPNAVLGLADPVCSVPGFGCMPAGGLGR
jgi:hypothetical protein